MPPRNGAHHQVVQLESSKLWTINALQLGRKKKKPKQKTKTTTNNKTTPKTKPQNPQTKEQQPPKKTTPWETTGITTQDLMQNSGHQHSREMKVEQMQRTVTRTKGTQS